MSPGREVTGAGRSGRNGNREPGPVGAMVVAKVGVAPGTAALVGPVATALAGIPEGDAASGTRDRSAAVPARVRVSGTPAAESDPGAVAGNDVKVHRHVRSGRSVSLEADRGTSPLADEGQIRLLPRTSPVGSWTAACGVN